MIKINFEGNKSVAYDDNKIVGECDFLEKEDTWNIVHTEVDEEYQGQGIARKLVECVIENAKKVNKRIMADCSYAKRVLERQSRLGGGKMYKTVVIDYSPKADDMAQKIEEKANEILQEGYELITMSITGTAKAILVFKKGLKKSLL